MFKKSDLPSQNQSIRFITFLSIIFLVFCNHFAIPSVRAENEILCEGSEMGLNTCRPKKEESAFIFNPPSGEECVTSRWMKPQSRSSEAGGLYQLFLNATGGDGSNGLGYDFTNLCEGACINLPWRDSSTVCMPTRLDCPNEEDVADGFNTGELGECTEEVNDKGMRRVKLCGEPGYAISVRALYCDCTNFD